MRHALVRFRNGLLRVNRPALARIDLSALAHNYRLAKKLHGGCALAVIKANAYGHGALPCAETLSREADGFAVAFLAEAIQLREGNIHNPILLLEGIFAARELEEVAQHNLWMVVHHPEQIRMIEAEAPQDARLHVWLKVNSGMNRAGFESSQVASSYRRLIASGKVAKITLMSHFSRADESNIVTTAKQIARFDAATCGLSGARSLSNSAAILACPASYREWARPGIMLYGAIPTFTKNCHLQQVMTLESAVMGVRVIQPGEEVGYGGRFVASRITRAGLVAMGYADGYPRSVAPGTPVSVNGVKTKVLGWVSMDMLTVDLTDIPSSGLGSRVVLWGEDISVVDVAAAAGTIAYELLSNVKRVKFQYLHSAQIVPPW